MMENRENLDIMNGVHLIFMKKAAVQRCSHIADAKKSNYFKAEGCKVNKHVNCKQCNVLLAQNYFH